MSQSPRRNTAHTTRPLFDEADIGSGEKTAAQKETEDIIRQIPPLPASSGPASGSGADATGNPGAP